MSVGDVLRYRRRVENYTCICGHGSTYHYLMGKSGTHEACAGESGRNSCAKGCQMFTAKVTKTPRAWFRIFHDPDAQLD